MLERTVNNGWLPTSFFISKPTTTNDSVANTDSRCVMNNYEKCHFFLLSGQKKKEHITLSVSRQRIWPFLVSLTCAWTTFRQNQWAFSLSVRFHKKGHLEQVRAWYLSNPLWINGYILSFLLCNVDSSCVFFQTKPKITLNCLIWSQGVMMAVYSTVWPCQQCVCVAGGDFKSMLDT